MSVKTGVALAGLFSRPVRRTEIATLATGAILVLAGLLPTAGEVDRRALLLTAAVTFGYALLWFRLLPQGLFGPWHFTIGMLTPVAIGVLLLSLTGGSGSNNFPLYLLPILGTAFGLAARTTLIAGSLAVIAYLWLFVGDIATGRPSDLQLGAVRLITLVIIIAFVWLIVRALHASRERLQADTEDVAALTAEVEAVVRTAHSAVISMDATGRVTRWNDQAVKTFGYDKEAAIGRELAELVILERSREAHRAGLRRFQATGEWNILGQRLELEVLHADGTEFPVEVTVAAHGSGDRRRFTAFVTDITARREAEAVLTRQAFHDALTGLPNRALLEDRLERAVAQARRGGEPTSILLMDLDHFKEINDRLGHEAGDRVLALFAARLQRIVRASDTAARLGGDEFVLLLPQTDQTGARQVAAGVLRGCEEPLQIGGERLTIGVSTGIATAPEDGSDVASLLRRADAAMYEAKRARAASPATT